MNLIALLAADPSETHHPFLAESAELLFGIPAALIIFAALFKFAGPMVKKSLAARTEKIQAEIDASSGDLAAAQSEASQIRQAKGDIDGERARLLAEADVQAESVLAEGRARVAAEAADLEARADADIVAAASRGADELRAEIARLSESVVDRVAEATIDPGLQNDLVESFISKVGAA